MKVTKWEYNVSYDTLEETIRHLIRLDLNIVTVVPTKYDLEDGALIKALIVSDDKPHIPGSGCGPG